MPVTMPVVTNTASNTTVEAAPVAATPITTAPTATAPTTGSVTIQATTTTTSKLKSILAFISLLAEAELPVFLNLNHNPQTAAEVEAGIVAVGLAAQLV